MLLVIENPRELDNDRLNLAHTLYRNKDLRAAYRRRFGPLPPMSEGARFPAHGSPQAAPDSPEGRAWRRMAAADQDAVNRVMANLGVALAPAARRCVAIRRSIASPPRSPTTRTRRRTTPSPPPPGAGSAVRRRGAMHARHSARVRQPGVPQLGVPVTDRKDTGREQGWRSP